MANESRVTQLPECAARQTKNNSESTQQAGGDNTHKDSQSEELQSQRHVGHRFGLRPNPTPGHRLCVGNDIALRSNVGWDIVSRLGSPSWEMK